MVFERSILEGIGIDEFADFTPRIDTPFKVSQITPTVPQEAPPPPREDEEGTQRALIWGGIYLLAIAAGLGGYYLYKRGRR